MRATINCVPFDRQIRSAPSYISSGFLAGSPDRKTQQKEERGGGGSCCRAELACVEAHRTSDDPDLGDLKALAEHGLAADGVQTEETFYATACALEESGSHHRLWQRFSGMMFRDTQAGSLLRQTLAASILGAHCPLAERGRGARLSGCRGRCWLVVRGLAAVALSISHSDFFFVDGALCCFLSS